MGDSGGNTRRGDRRKRKQSGNGLLLIALMILLVMLTSCIRNIKAELEEIQIILNRIEILQYGNAETTAQTEEETDFVGSIDIIDVEKPVQRTWTETLQRLDELGQINPIIEESVKITLSIRKVCWQLWQIIQRWQISYQDIWMKTGELQKD
jgi:hypothetical protein